MPLNETAIARLSHSAMTLDIYTWLAQRLHRVKEGKIVLVPWVSLWEQFDNGYAQIRQFRWIFKLTANNSATLEACPDAATETKKELCCTFVVPAL